MKRYEASIKIINKDYIDPLIVALARQGYSPYIPRDDDAVCFQIQEEELIEIHERL